MLPAQTTKQKMNMYKIAKMENKKHRRRRVDEDGTKSPPKKSPEIQGRKELQCVLLLEAPIPLRICSTTTPLQRDKDGCQFPYSS
jgi:hypothetical protein